MDEGDLAPVLQMLHERLLNQISRDSHCEISFLPPFLDCSIRYRPRNEQLPHMVTQPSTSESEISKTFIDGVSRMIFLRRYSSYPYHQTKYEQISKIRINHQGLLAQARTYAPAVPEDPPLFSSFSLNRFAPFLPDSKRPFPVLYLLRPGHYW